MTKAKIIGLSVGGLVLVTGIGFALLFGQSGREVRRVLALQQQLLTSDLSASESNTLKTQLMRSIDELDRDTLHELQNQMREAQREQTRASVAAYQAAVGDEKTAVLDEALDRYAQAREVGRDAFGTRRRGMPRAARAANGRPDRTNERGDDSARKNGARPDGGGDRGPREETGRRRGGGDRDRGDRQPMSDAEREQWSQYREALRNRAEERGMELGRRRRG